MTRVAVHLGSLLADRAEIGRCRALLSPAERVRAERFRHEHLQRRFVIRRARLRERLAAVTGDRPAALELRAGGCGKPHLPGGPAFSTSHAGEHWAVGIGAFELGIDIEMPNPAIEWRAVAARLFAPAEARAITSAADFYACWARKEAFVKAIGLGLSYPLDQFEVSVRGEACFRRGGEGWQIAALPLGQEIAGALVTIDNGTPLELSLVNEAPRARAA